MAKEKVAKAKTTKPKTAKAKVVEGKLIALDCEFLGEVKKASGTTYNKVFVKGESVERYFQTSKSKVEDGVFLVDETLWNGSTKK